MDGRSWTRAAIRHGRRKLLEETFESTNVSSTDRQQRMVALGCGLWVRSVALRYMEDHLAGILSATGGSLPHCCLSGRQAVTHRTWKPLRFSDESKMPSRLPTIPCNRAAHTGARMHQHVRASRIGFRAVSCMNQNLRPALLMISAISASSSFICAAICSGPV